MEEILQQIFQQSFDVNEIDNSMSIENVKGWDSMAHVGLMLALQKKFGVSISPAVAIELTDVAAIKKFLNKMNLT